MVNRMFRPAIMLVAALVGGWRLVFAYIDPNTGGMLFQFLAVAFTMLTGVLFFFSRQIRVFAAQMRRFLNRNHSDE